MWVDAPWRAARSLAHVPGCSCVPWVMFQGNVSGLKGNNNDEYTLYIRYTMAYPQTTSKTPNVWLQCMSTCTIMYQTLNLGTNYVYLKRKWSIQTYSVLLIHHLKPCFQAIIYGTCFFSVTTGFPDQTMRTPVVPPKLVIPSAPFPEPCKSGGFAPLPMLQQSRHSKNWQETRYQQNITTILYHTILKKWLFHGVSL